MKFFRSIPSIVFTCILATAALALDKNIGVALNYSIGPGQVVPTPAAPATLAANTALPSITPTSPVIGTAETTTSGTWTGSPSSYNYSWQTCTNLSANNCTTLGVSTTSYTPTAFDAGLYYRTIVSANNAAGVSAIAISPLVGPVPSAGGGSVAVNTSPPVITPSSPVVGALETSTSGSWTQSPTSYNYSWQTCPDTSGTGCTNLSVFTATYTPVSGDVGNYYRTRVTAVNGAGTSAVATSAIVGPVTTGTVVRGFAQGMKTTLQGYEADTAWSEVTRSKHTSQVAFSRSKVVIPTYLLANVTSGTSTTAIRETDLPGSYKFSVVLEPNCNTARTAVPVRNSADTYQFSGSGTVLYNGPGTNTNGYIVSDWLTQSASIPANQDFCLWTTVQNQYAGSQVPTAISVTGTGSSATETVTVPSTAGMWAPSTNTAGESVIQAGMSPTGYNGTFVISSIVDATHYTAVSSAFSGLGAASAFGTASVSSLPFGVAFSSFIPRNEGQTTNQISGANANVDLIATAAGVNLTTVGNVNSTLNGANAGMTPAMLLIDYPSSSKNVSILGDSICYGVGESAQGSVLAGTVYGDSRGDSARNSGYCERLIEETLSTNVAINLSKGGDSYHALALSDAGYSNFRYRLGLWTLANATHGFLENGHNDLSAGYNPTQIAGYMNNVVGQITTATPSAKLVQTLITPDGQTWINPTAVSESGNTVTVTVASTSNVVTGQVGIVTGFTTPTGYNTPTVSINQSTAPTESGTTITYTVSSTANIVNGQNVTTAGFTPAGYNLSNVAATVVDSTHFTVQGASGLGAAQAGSGQIYTGVLTVTDGTHFTYVVPTSGLAAGTVVTCTPATSSGTCVNLTEFNPAATYTATGWGASSSNRGAFDALVRAKDSSLGIIASYFDPNVGLENGYAFNTPATESSQWPANGTDSFFASYDGTHPNSRSAAFIAAGTSNPTATATYVLP